MDKKEIRKFILQLGITPDLIGFKYIISAVDLMIKGGAKSMTKEVYPGVAKEYNTVPQHVERGIRHAISTVLNSPYGYEILENAFECKILTEKFTNTKFLFLCADTLKNRNT